ncbi:MAG: hypothetical protein NZ602_03390 [Thermoguttaceae bacterium]|nr:hypothetical protein [Thermoguttaceae bacterium]MDW8037189.1 hypothetical protein [Thermoguttaceae bacterium]
MASTLETFVERLKADGVEAGRQAAEAIRRQAEQQAAQRLQEAEAEAKRIIAAAQAEREKILARTQTELRLAARDTLHRLREALEKALQQVLLEAAERHLQDETFLRDLIREVVCQYAKADADQQDLITINLSESMRRRLTDWAIGAFHNPDCPQELPVELHGTLTGAGFEYRLSGGTVEVTPESVVDVLLPMVSPEVQKLLQEVAKELLRVGSEEPAGVR